MLASVIVVSDGNVTAFLPLSRAVDNCVDETAGHIFTTLSQNFRQLPQIISDAS